jgi:hypothetical protein
MPAHGQSQVNQVNMPSAVLKHHYLVQDVQGERRPPSSEVNPLRRTVEGTMDNNDVLTLNEAAVLLRVHPVTLRKRAVAWAIPHRRLGTEWRFSRNVTTWIQRGEDNVA